MSELKVDKVSPRTGNYVSLNTVGSKNIIINGDMSIAQRGTSTASITSTGYYTVDRFKSSMSSAGTWTMSQDTDVPSGQGFATSTKLDCTTANGSLSAGSFFLFTQNIEGQNLQYLKKGTANAESLTLSFWVKSNKTGTYIVEFADNDNTRYNNQSYTIDASNTWEKKIITIPGDTTGTLDNDNQSSLYVAWWLLAGTNFTSGTLQNSWQSNTNANRAVGQVNLADNTANEWFITGVQLEAGTTASDFEFLPVDMNLQRCQRYFQVLGDGTYTDTSSAGDRIAIGQRGSSGLTIGYPIIFTQCQMRATPSITHNNVNVRQDTTDYTLSAIASIKNFGMTIGFTITSSSALNTGESFQLRTTGSDGYIKFDAEL